MRFRRPFVLLLLPSSWLAVPMVLILGGCGRLEAESLFDHDIEPPVEDEELALAPGGTRIVVFPNPCRQTVRLRVPAWRASRIAVRIYNVRGQLVRLLRCEASGARDPVVEWDVTDERGRRVASGAYYVRLETRGAPAVPVSVLVLR